jgi:hypothetical protein
MLCNPEAIYMDDCGSCSDIKFDHTAQDSTALLNTNLEARAV